MVALQRSVPCEALVALLLPLSLTTGALLPTDALVDPKARTTLLHSAVERGMPRVATTLLAAGADPNPKVRKSERRKGGMRAKWGKARLRVDLPRLPL